MISTIILMIRILFNITNNYVPEKVVLQRYLQMGHMSITINKDRNIDL